MIAHRPVLGKGAPDVARVPLSVGALAVRVSPLAPEDTIAKAVEAVRLSPASAVPVAEDGRIVGVVTAAELKSVLAGGGSAGHLRALPVRTAVPSDLLCLRESVSVEQALETFRDNGIDAAPVLDDMGRYTGIVGISTLLSAVCGMLRPANIGGLATPLGVYLTNGAVRAGVGDLGLLSAGVFIGVLQLLASWCAFKLAPFVAGALGALAGWLAGNLSGRAHAALWQDPFWPYSFLALLLFGLFFRLSWVTGLHAAEHQVVHAIEMGDDLTPEAVRGKPRIHPRCGTNLVAAFGTYMLLRSVGEGWDIVAFPAVLLTWRIWGSFLQQHVTTRAASDRQIASGIAAGRELLNRYQSSLGQETPRWRRLWNLGLIQVALGFACLWYGLTLFNRWVPLDREWLLYLGL